MSGAGSSLLGSWLGQVPSLKSDTLQSPIQPSVQPPIATPTVGSGTAEADPSEPPVSDDASSKEESLGKRAQCDSEAELARAIERINRLGICKDQSSSDRGLLDSKKRRLGSSSHFLPRPTKKPRSLTRKLPPSP